MNKNTAVETIPVFKPLLEKEEFRASQKALEVGWLGMGSFVGEFEHAISNVLGHDHEREVVAVSTGHAALHMAMMLAGIKPGDEVITPSFNNVADFQAVIACGGVPVFVDILEETLCVDPEAITRSITEKTKAIIAMDYGHNVCDHGALQKISEATGIPIIHDAAHSFGSYYESEPIGLQHDFTMFSFDPVKTVTSIDGGALVVKKGNHRQTLESMRLIGMTQPSTQMYKNERAWSYDVEQLGYRYHMSNVHAAIGLEQLKKLDSIRESRRQTLSTYSLAFSGMKNVLIPSGDFSNSNPFLYHVRIPHSRRGDFRRHLLNEGVDTGIHWQAGHSFSLFKDAPRGDLRVTEKISSEVVTLPLHSKMREEFVDRVVNSVRSFS